MNPHRNQAGHAAGDQAQIASFKDWQDKHNEEGCTYSGTMTNTFGAVH